MKKSSPTLDKILEAQVQRLATTLRPGTVWAYRFCTRGFLAYVHANFPHLHHPSQLRRDPHLLGWFRFLCQHQPPLRNVTRQQRLIVIRRLLRDLAESGYPITSDLIRCEDFPPHDHYLPRPLPPDQDQHLQQQLRQSDTLEAHALRLIRATRSASANVSIFPWIACSKSVNAKLRSTCPWASSIPNAGSRSMRRRGACWHG